MSSSQAPRPMRVMVYSDDRNVRRTVINALGTPDEVEARIAEMIP